MSQAIAEDAVQVGAAADGQSAGTVDVSQIVSFRLASELYGVDIMRVQEIILPGQITEVPQVPDYVRGLINLRGHIIPVLDLRMRFGLPVSDPTEETRIIVIEVGNRTVGVVVDAVNEVLRISRDQVEPPPTNVGEMDQRHVTGLVKLDQKLLILLRVEDLLAPGDVPGGGDPGVTTGDRPVQV